MREFKLYCIDRPLLSNETQDAHGDDEGDFCEIKASEIQLHSLGDCAAYLWSHGRWGRRLMAKVDELAAEFRFSFDPAAPGVAVLAALSEAVEGCYQRLTQFALQLARGREGLVQDRKVRLALETCLMGRLHRKVFGAVITSTCKSDARINKRSKNASVMAGGSDSLADAVGVPAAVRPAVAKARAELSKIVELSTPLEKHRCLQKSIAVLTSAGGSGFSGDGLLPSVLYLILKTKNVRHWTAHLQYATNFSLATSRAQLSRNEQGYIWSTVEAALGHIQECRDFAARLEKSPSAVRSGDLFDSVRRGDVERVVAVLGGRCSEKTHWSRHHPLCACLDCTEARSSGSGDREVAVVADSVHSLTPSQMQTPLHVACIYGQSLVIEALLERGARTDCLDAAGMSPLHHAALRGHQNALLQLLYAKAPLNLAVRDDGMDTVLHLAARNGHESCVKALVYYAEHHNASSTLRLNAQNRSGDTALHLASRWGYLEIASILVGCGADAHGVRNRRRENAFECAHSGLMAAILKKKIQPK